MAVAVLTRDSFDAQPYGAALAPLGLSAVAMPVTKPAPAADPDALVRALGRGSYDVIMVASPRAAHELARAVAAATPLRATMLDMPDVWAVGPATKRALDIAKLPAQLPANVKDGAELARMLVAKMKLRGKRVLVPRAEEGRTEAIEILRAAGAEVVDVVAYRTVAVAADEPSVQEGAQLLRDGNALLCCVFAPSQVAALSAIVGPLAKLSTTFAAIGETTALALREAGVDRLAVADLPTPEGMAQAVRPVYPA
ncbi:MAG TPA: uroporphyrinogen-III synthase [Kofleriaceae bacterium]|nr:uroporphyrinogen-III synthase [Kofleriaceae bacterium]